MNISFNFAFLVLFLDRHLPAEQNSATGSAFEAGSKDETSSENYNDLINSYINKFLDHKKPQKQSNTMSYNVNNKNNNQNQQNVQQNRAQSSSFKPSSFDSKQNYMNLKSRHHTPSASNSVPTKSTPPNNFNNFNANNNANFNSNNNNNVNFNNNGNFNSNNNNANSNMNFNQNKNNENNNNKNHPKFKIIKEFRVTLDDLKKMKLTPFMLKNGVNVNGNAVLAMPRGALDQLTGTNNIFNILQASSSNTSTRRIGVARPQGRKLGSFIRSNYRNNGSQSSNAASNQFARRSSGFVNKNMVTIGQESRYLPVRILAVDNKFNLQRN